MPKFTFAVVVFLLIALERSFVDPAALPSKPDTPAQLFHDSAPHVRVTAPPPMKQKQLEDEEAQLQSLKKPASMSVVESHSERRTQDAEQKQLHSDTHRQQVSLDGQLVAALERSVDTSPQQAGLARASLNVPPLGVSQSVEAPLPPTPQRRSPQPPIPQSPQDSDMRGGGQVTALDMAQYIFWTGDERGVSLAIQEFLQQGLMTREEAVVFLREIRQGLDALQAYYAQRRDEQQAAEQQALERAAALQQALALSRLREAASQQQMMIKKSVAPSQPPLLSEEEYSELLQRLREADSLYTEFALEEIIYQLAKALFSQSLDRGRGEAQASLQRFSELLRSEAEQGRIAHALESKLLDVLGASLMDALRERPLVSEVSAEVTSPGGKQALQNLVKGDKP